MSCPPDDGHYSGSFRIATYIAAPSVGRFLTTPQKVLQVIDWLEALGVEHVFLEIYRGGIVADESLLVQARDMLRQAGIRVGGGLTTTWGEGFGDPALPNPDEQGYLFCYSSTKTAQDVAKICARAVKIFDELIFDDYFFTNCECDTCRTAKGTAPWWTFRNKLLTKFADNAILAPIRKANPNCKVIVKYPQWYDRFHQFGYDVEARTKQFDAVWIGTETRNYYGDDKLSCVPQTQSWSVYRWLQDLAGPKTLGGWFDPFNCDAPSYVEQAYQNVLIGTPEILLFSYGSLQWEGHKTLIEALKREIPTLRRWSAALGGSKPTGVSCYKPPNSHPRSEPYVCDYLSVLGIPTTMHATFPADSPIVFLPAQALGDRDILSKVRSRIASGGSVLATGQFLMGLEDRQSVGELFGLTPRTSPDEGPTYTRRIHVGDEGFRMRRYMNLTGALEATDAEVLISWGPDRRLSPYFTCKRHGGGAGMMLDTYTVAFSERAGVNIHRPVRIVDLPQPALDCIRKHVTLPLALEIRCPGRVGVYCFDAGPLAICNYRNERVEVEVTGREGSPLGPLDSLVPEEGSEAVIETHRSDHLKLTLPPRSRILLAGSSE